MARQELDYSIAHAAAWDAGNASMRMAGRTKWSDEDFNVCIEVWYQLMPEGASLPQSQTDRVQLRLL